jgi:MFS family permease
MLATTRECCCPTATYAMFLAAGLGFGIWAANIPVLKQRFELSGSALSIILLAVAAGSIVSMPIAGQAVRHFGSRHCVAVSLGCYALCLTFLALAPNLFSRRWESSALSMNIKVGNFPLGLRVYKSS